MTLEESPNLSGLSFLYLQQGWLRMKGVKVCSDLELCSICVNYCSYYEKNPNPMSTHILVCDPPLPEPWADVRSEQFWRSGEEQGESGRAWEWGGRMPGTWLSPYSLL